MGTTRIKVIDLSSDEKEIKTSRKHAEKLTGAAKLKAAGPEGTSPNQRFSGTGGLARREEKKPKKEPRGKEGREDKEGIEGKEEISAQVSTEEPSAPTQPSQPSEPSEPSQPSTPSEQSKPSQPSLHHKGHKYLAAKAKIEKGKQYKAKEAIALLTETSTVKFDPTVELHLNVVDKSIKSTVSLPHPFETKTKEKRYLVFSEKKQEVDGAKIIWGDDKIIDEIEGGQLKPGKDFEAVVSTPQFMPKIAKIAKILGPAGLMPNPKNKTVTEDIAQALKTKDEGFTIRCEQQAPIIHTKLGKLSNKQEELEENLKALIFAIGPSKIKRATLTSSMGPGIKLDIASFSVK